MHDSAPEAPRALGWSPALDGLRAVAVLLVMFFHYGRDAWVDGGYLGVDIFFVLSGFLITTLLLQEWQRRGSLDLGAFYARRALRLIPALAAFVGVYLAAVVLFPGTWLRPGQSVGDAFQHAGMALGYVHNWSMAADHDAPHSFGHVWSLAIEAQFYLVWPFVLIAMLALRLSRRLVFSCTAALALISATSVFWLDRPSWEPMYYGTQFRAHELLIGALAAQLFVWGVVTRHVVRSRRYLALAAVSVIFVAALVLGSDEHMPLMFVGGFQLASIAAAVVVLYCTLARDAVFARALAWTPLAYIGRRSYAMYLWHLPVGYSLRSLDLVPEALARDGHHDRPGGTLVPHRRTSSPAVERQVPLERATSRRC